MQPDDGSQLHAENIEALSGSPAAPTLATPAPPPNEDAPERQDIDMFVGENRGKFLPLYDAIVARRSAIGWCWPGLLFPTAWFLYRKMYILAGLACITAVIVGSTHILPPYLMWLGLWPSILGAVGRRFYLAGARRTIAEIRAEEKDELTAQSLIKGAGGVSVAGAVIGALIYLSVIVVTGQNGVNAPFGSRP